MIAEQLKKSILQAAIQGKLTEQLPEDGNARDLLKDIQKEKARLIKEGKIKKEKPLPEITEDEIPFDIPDNWCWVRLGEFASVINGDRGKNYPGKEHWTTTGIPFINAGCLEEKYLSEKYFNYIPESRYEILRGGFIEKGDILYCLRGSLGKMSINSRYEEGAIASSLSIIRLFNPDILEFLYIVLSSKYGTELINLVNNGTAQPNLSAKNVGNFIIPLPPLEEQDRIVDRLKEFLSEIDKLKSDETKLEDLQKSFPKKMKDAILQYAIQGKLTEQLPDDGNARDLLKEIQKEKARLIKEGKIKKEKPLPEITEDEIPFEIPENWCWVRLVNLCEYIQRGKSPKYSHVKKYPVIAQKCNQWEGFSIDKAQFIEPDTVKNYTEERILKNDDLMWNSTGLGTLGRIVMYEESKNPYGFAVADSHVTVIRMLKNYLCPRYVYAYISGPYIQSIVEDISSGSTKQKELSTQTIKKLIVPLPPIAEQRRIADRLEGLLSLCKTLK